MFTVRDSIKVPKSVFMGGQVNSLTYEGEEFKFIINGEPKLIISSTGVSAGNGITFPIESGVLYVDEENKRVGINITDPQSALDVSGDASILGELSATALQIAGNGLVVGDLTVSGTLNAQLPFNLFDLTVSGDLTVGNDASIGNDLDVGGFLTAQGINFDDVNVSGDLTVQGDLAVSGSLTAQSINFTDVAVTGDLTVTGGLNVFGSNSFFENDVLITGTLSANNLDFNNVLINNLDVTNDLTVTGNTNLIGDLFVTGALTDIRTDMIVEGDLSVSGNLIGLDCTCSSLITSGFILAQEDISTSQALVGNNLSIGGSGLVAGDLTVSGSIQGNINVSFQGAVENLTVTNDAFIGNDVSVGRSLAVDSDCLVVGDLTVSGAIQGNINVSFTGVVDNLTVSGDLTVGPSAGTAVFTNASVSISAATIENRSNQHDLFAGAFNADCTAISHVATQMSLRATQFDILANELRITAPNPISIGEDVIVPGELRADNITLGVTSYTYVTTVGNIFQSNLSAGFVTLIGIGSIAAGGSYSFTLQNPLITENSFLLLSLRVNDIGLGFFNIMPATITNGASGIIVVNGSNSAVFFTALRFQYIILGGTLVV